MPSQSWVQTLYTIPVAGANLTASAAATSLLPNASPRLTFPNSFFASIGQTLRIKGAAQLGNIVTTPGTLTLDIRLGGTVVFTSGAMQLSTTAHTTLPLWYEILLTLRAVGTAANFMGQGTATSQCLSLTAVADSTTTPATLLMPNTVPTVGNNVDATTALALDHFGTFSLNNANAIQLQQFSVESMN
jgi:hypothetical protein